MTVNELEVYVKGVRTWSGLHMEAGQPDGNVTQVLGIFGSGTESRPEPALQSKIIVRDHIMIQQNDNPFDNIRPAKTTVTITMELNPETASQLQKLKGGEDWEQAIQKLLQIRKEKLENQKPEPVKTESRHIPKEIEHYVREKYNDRCAFPGCNREYRELHHTQGFSLKKIHDPDKIAPLCEAHHSLAHRGLIENENKQPQFWKIRKNPDKTSPRFFIDQFVTQKKTQQFQLAT